MCSHGVDCMIECGGVWSCPDCGDDVISGRAQAHMRLSDEEQKRVNEAQQREINRLEKDVQRLAAVRIFREGGGGGGRKRGGKERGGEKQREGVEKERGGERVPSKGRSTGLLRMSRDWQHRGDLGREMGEGSK